MKGFIENILADIIEEYAIEDIKNECEVGKERNFTEENKVMNKALLRYAAHSIKIDVEKNKIHQQRYDWDSITYKDKEGNLLYYVSEYILAEDEISRKIASTKVIYQAIENLRKYYEREFEDKVEEAKECYRYYGSRDYMEY